MNNERTGNQLAKDKEDIISELRFKQEYTINKPKTDETESLIKEIELSSNYTKFIDILNRLLVNPNHRSYQYIAKFLQDIKSPSTIEYVRIALDSNFNYLEYTCSKPEVTAKWFSWLLASINTKESIDLIEEYTKSENEGISKEMIYRLDKVKRIE